MNIQTFTPRQIKQITFQNLTERENQNKIDREPAQTIQKLGLVHRIGFQGIQSMLGTPRSNGCRRQLSFTTDRAIRLCGTADHVNVGCVVQSRKGGHSNCPRPQKKKIYRFPVLRFYVLRVGCCDSRAPELANRRADMQLELS
jgi:hypothetical protein